MLSDAFIAIMEQFLKDNNLSYGEMVNKYPTVIVGETTITLHPAYNNYEEVSGLLYHFEKPDGKVILNGTIVSREAKELPVDGTLLLQVLQQL